MNIQFINSSSNKATEILEKIEQNSQVESFVITKLTQKNKQLLKRALSEKFTVRELEKNSDIGIGEIWLIDSETAYCFDGQLLSISLKAKQFNFGNIIQKSLNEVYVFSKETFLFKYVNEGALKNLKYTKEEMLAMTPWDIKPTYAENEFKSLLTPLLKGKQKQLRFETTHRRKDGTDYNVEVYLQIINDSGIDYFNAIILDITEQKNATATALKAKEQLELLASNYPNGSISLIDKNLNFLFTGGEGYKEYNIDPTTFIGKSAKEALAPKVFEELQKIAKIINFDQSIGFEVSFSKKTFQNTLKAIKDENGELEYYILRVIDVTELKDQYEQTKKERNNYLAVSNALNKSALVSKTDKHGIIIHANEEFYRISQFTENELIGKSHSIINSSYHPKSFWTEMWKTVTKGKTWRAEVKNRAKDGTYYWVDTVINPVFDIKGEIKGFLSIRYLITAKKALEEQQIQLTKKLKLAAQSSNLGVWNLYLNTKSMEVDAQTLKIYGVKKIDNLDDWVASIHPDDLKEITRALFDFQKSNHQLDLKFRIIWPNGEIRYNRSTALKSEEDENFVVGVTWDITEEVLTQHKIQDLKESYELALMGSKDGFWDSNLKTGKIKYSQGWFRLLGIAEHQKEVTGDSSIWQKYVHPDDLENTNETVARAITNNMETYEVETRMRHAKGHYIETIVRGYISRDIYGAAIRTTGTMMDISRIKEADKLITHLIDKFSSLINSLNGIVWESDPKTFQATFISDQVKEITGYTTDEWTKTKGFWINRIHPEDKKNVQDYLKNNLHKKNRHTIEYRFKKKNDEYIWISDIITVEFNNDKVISLKGIMIDISRTKEAESKVADLLKDKDELIESIDGVIWEIPFGNDSFNFVSQKSEKILGYTSTEMLQPHFWVNHMHKDDQIWAPNYCDSQAKALSNYEFEYRMVHKNGSVVWLRDLVTVNHENGKPTFLKGIMLDITAEINAREELTKSEEKFRFITENTSDGIAIMEDDKITYTSETYDKIIGYSSEESLTHDREFMYNMIHPEDRDELFKTIDSEIKNHSKHLAYSYRIKHKKGHYIWREVNTSFIYDSLGKLTRAVIVARDITERKEIEIALQESEGKHRYLVEASQELVCIHDIDGIYKFLSPSVTNILGYTADELIGQDPYSLFHPEDIDKIMKEAHAPLLKGINVKNIQYRIRKKDGAYIWFDTYTESIKDSSGNISSLISGSRDITELKVAQLKLKESQELLSNVANNIPGVIWRYVLDKDGNEKMEYVSEGAEKIWGLSKESVLQDIRPLRNQIHSDDTERFNASVMHSAIHLEQWECEYRIVTSDGKTKWLTGAGQPKILNDGSIVWNSIALDITDKKTAELELEKTLRHLNLAIKTAKMGIWEWDLETDELQWNDESLNIYGISRDKFKNNSDFFWSILDKNHKEILDENIQKAREGEEVTYVYKIETKDNKVKYIQSSAARIVKKDGNTNLLFGINLDITPLVQNQLNLENALKEKDTLFKELHHRIKNNLQMVISLLFLKDDSSTDEKLNSFIKETSTKIQSISAIHEQLLQMQGIDELDIKEYLSTLVSNLMYTYSDKNTGYELDMKMDRVQLNIDTALSLGLIVNEMISNALKYAYPDTNKGKIKVHLKKLDKLLQLEVSDEGIGISNEKLSKLEGSYGLQLVSLFTKQIKGELSITNDRGTKFNIKFPINA